ncbi:MAG: GNAT family N-acetyltransferase [Clostridium sp.]|uniref:GNAT family N-acetyltransferase n=1 Tax=Clostridium sp. TaxID=1506 RepID=UPI003D6C8BA4
MKYNQWSKEINVYELSEGYSIHKAEWKEFSIHFATYEIFSINVWFRQSFDMYCSVLKDCDICYWIKKDGHRMGGVLLEPNYMNCLFLEPPYNQYDEVLNELRNILICWSDESKKIIVGGVKPQEIKYYQRAGFRTGKARRCMIRPTEEFNINWSDEYQIVLPTVEREMEIVKLFNEAFQGGVGDDGNSTIDKQQESVKYYLNDNLQNNLVNKASTLIYYKKTNELVGACLISIWEEWPNVYDIAVKPSFQGNGLARNMIKKALTVLKEQHTVLRLFVTLGNDAEMSYHKLGFLAGVETTEMFLVEKESVC